MVAGWLWFLRYHSRTPSDLEGYDSHRISVKQHCDPSESIAVRLFWSPCGHLTSESLADALRDRSMQTTSPNFYTVPPFAPCLPDYPSCLVFVILLSCQHSQGHILFCYWTRVWQSHVHCFQQDSGNRLCITTTHIADQLTSLNLNLSAAAALRTIVCVGL